MRYYNFINENQTIDDSRNRLLQKKCSYYLSLIGNTMMFTRGLAKPEDSLFYLKQMRIDRKPKGTKPIYYKKLNNWLKMNGHIPRDNAVIATSHEKKTITGFGKNFYIFPIGKFNYTYIKSKDFNMDDDRTGYEHDMVDFFFTNKNTSFPSYFVTNKDLYDAYYYRYEIWFDCKEYYVASIEDYHWNKNTQQLERRTGKLKG